MSVIRAALLSKVRPKSLQTGEIKAYLDLLERLLIQTQDQIGINEGGVDSDSDDSLVTGLLARVLELENEVEYLRGDTFTQIQVEPDHDHITIDFHDVYERLDSIEAQI